MKPNHLWYSWKLDIGATRGRRRSKILTSVTALRVFSSNMKRWCSHELMKHNVWSKHTLFNFFQFGSVKRTALNLGDFVFLNSCSAWKCLGLKWNLYCAKHWDPLGYTTPPISCSIWFIKCRHLEWESQTADLMLWLHYFCYTAAPCLKSYLM